VSGAFAPVVRQRRFAIFGVSCLGIGIAWLIVVHSLPSYLASVAPEVALWLNPNEPTALLQLAEKRLAEAPPSATNAQDVARATDDEIRNLVVRALAVDPLNAHAVALLADLAERAGDTTSAQEFLEATVRRSLREGPALYKLILHSLGTGRIKQAADYTDVLLRTRPEAFQDLVPVLVSIAGTSDGIAALTQILRRRPEWRTEFINLLPSKVADIQVPQALLLGLKNTEAPPTNAELWRYLWFLWTHNLHGPAYYTWLQFTPIEHFDHNNLLFNGAFARPTTGLLFDWVISGGVGLTADIIVRPDANGDNGLNLMFGGSRAQFYGVTQGLVLPPGTYRFRGKYKGRLVGQRGLKWRMTCAGAVLPPIMETPMVLGLHPTWVNFEFSYTVPDAQCRGQTLHLLLDARSASEQIVSGSMWYKDLQITRVLEVLDKK
jgi:hypothetical protein